MVLRALLDHETNTATESNNFLLSSFFVDQLPRINESLLKRSLGYSLDEQHVYYLATALHIGLGIGAFYTAPYLTLSTIALSGTNNFLNGAGYEYKKSLYEYLGIDNYYGIALDSVMSSGVLYMQFDAVSAVTHVTSLAKFAATGKFLFDGLKLGMAYMAPHYPASQNSEVIYKIEKGLPAVAQGLSDLMVVWVMFEAASNLGSDTAVKAGIGAGVITAMTYVAEVYWVVQDKPPVIESQHVHKPVNCICSQQDFIVDMQANCATIKTSGNVPVTDEL